MSRRCLSSSLRQCATAASSCCRNTTLLPVDIAALSAACCRHSPVSLLVDVAALYHCSSILLKLYITAALYYCHLRPKNWPPKTAAAWLLLSTSTLPYSTSVYYRRYYRILLESCWWSHYRCSNLLPKKFTSFISTKEAGNKINRLLTPTTSRKHPNTLESEQRYY